MNCSQVTSNTELLVPLKSNIQYGIYPDPGDASIYTNKQKHVNPNVRGEVKIIPQVLKTIKSQPGVKFYQVVRPSNQLSKAFPRQYCLLSLEGTLHPSSHFDPPPFWFLQDFEQIVLPY